MVNIPGPQRPTVNEGVPDRVPLDQRFVRGDLYAIRAAVAAHASALGAAQEDVENLVIVASELATNAIVHGGGSGRLRLWSVDGMLAMQVADEGQGLPDPDHAGLRRQDPAAPGGRGLWLARQLCTQVRIHADAAGTQVTVAVRLTGADATAG
jgi:anti-sigma regulatory factor (Ser/Thr protein kinase)